MRFYNFINEAGLGGKSRSGGISNWEYYVSKSFPENNILSIDKNVKFFDMDFNEKGTLSKNEEIEVLETNLVEKGNSKFAKVRRQSDGETGLVNIGSIRKPTSEKKGSAIPGGTNSKEFTPDKLYTDGREFSNKEEFSSFVWDQLNSVYTDDKYKIIKMYLKECLDLVGRTRIISEEKFSKEYKIKGNYEISDDDIKILSKNFGEIILGLYILANNKKAKSIGYPSNISQQLYDFYTLDNRGIKQYYSAKSHGGSSTSIENINFIIRNFSDDNYFFKKYDKEVKVIQSLMNNKKEGITTIKNIQRFFENQLPEKTNEIIKELNKLTPKYRIKDISQSSLNEWFSYMTGTVSAKKFVETMQKIYEEILGDKGRMKGTSEKVLKQMHNLGDSSKFYNGYIYYPMGSYIVNYLNNTGNYLEVLNKLLNLGSFITQIESDLTKSSIIINIKQFKKINFKFSYNAGSKYPGNRPIGFKAQ